VVDELHRLDFSRPPYSASYSIRFVDPATVDVLNADHPVLALVTYYRFHRTSNGVISQLDKGTVPQSLLFADLSRR
jgi:hypothetical protein